MKVNLCRQLLPPAPLLLKSPAGDTHACGITTTGTLKCWCLNANGQIGVGNFVDRSSPVVVDLGTSYSRIAAGGNHTCGITSSGGLKCWVSSSGTSPAAVDSGKSSSKIAAGISHRCGITNAGPLKCWGKMGTVDLARVQ
jgi:hypothetical protein